MELGYEFYADLILVNACATTSELLIISYYYLSHIPTPLPGAILDMYYLSYVVRGAAQR